MEYNPVCAGPAGGPYQTYGNECARAYESCSKKIGIIYELLK